MNSVGFNVGTIPTADTILEMTTTVSYVRHTYRQYRYIRCAGCGRIQISHSLQTYSKYHFITSCQLLSLSTTTKKDSTPMSTVVSFIPLDGFFFDIPFIII